MATDMTEWCTDRPTLTMLGLYDSPRLQAPPEPYTSATSAHVLLP